MKIVEVNDTRKEQDFLTIAVSLYSNDPEWVRPLDKDIQDTFDKEENPKFSQGEAKRWLLQDDNGKYIGRIAAFYSPTDFKGDKKTGGCGFFECINNQDAADILFNTAAEWLKEKGCTEMEGPVNFGERDRFWGLMVQGFKRPSYLEGYNPPYYQALFENYGFKKTIEQSTSEIKLRSFKSDRFERIAQRVLTNPRYKFEHFKKGQLDKYTADFVEIYNKAWANHEHFIPMTKEKVRGLLKSLKPIMVEEFIWFAYVDGKPAGIFANVIDVNQLFKHVNGKMNLWGVIKFLWNKRKVNRIRGIVFGLIPEVHNTGVETGMIMKNYRELKKRPQFDSAELAWIGDFNPKMHSLFSALGAETTKVHYTYCKNL